MTVYLNSDSNYRLAVGIKQIELAILAAIPHLGSNYRHPLLFDVRVLPGDRTDALTTSIGSIRNRARRQE